MFITGWPSWAPCYQITTPLVYTEDLSIAQQIAHIFGAVKEIKESLKGYLTISQYNDFLRWLDDELSAVAANANTYTDAQVAALESRINDKIGDITEGALQWDVTAGTYTNTVDAMRNMFNDVTFRAWTNGEFATKNYTVAQVAESGLNTRGWAVANTWVQNGFALTPYYIAEPMPDEGATYTYEQVQEIIGEPMPGAVDPYYNVEDLANSAVRLSRNVYRTEE